LKLKNDIVNTILYYYNSYFSKKNLTGLKDYYSLYFLPKTLHINKIFTVENHKDEVVLINYLKYLNILSILWLIKFFNLLFR